MDQVKKDIKEPILEDTLYDGGDVTLRNCTGSRRNKKIPLSLHVALFLYLLDPLYRYFCNELRDEKG